MIVRWGAVAASLCLVGGCGWAGSDGRDHDPANRPGYARPGATTTAAPAMSVDGATYSGVAGGSVWTPDGWGSATDRYDIDATAGVSTMTVERV